MTTPKPTPPRGTTRIPAGTRPPDLRPCPGCGEMIARTLVACAPCWRLVPGVLKEQFGRSAPGSAGRMRIVAEMRAHLRGDTSEESQ